ncbi:ATP-binding protein [Streptomyces sp. V3I7]|uniref:ATP-binding protein n=1 Tax=Streptomyces sp. V3I7 TaxID=3042278 RepID=UPI00277DD790|nr:ATP-binding protein [Streptomyces sp. V3I7]MDQ0992011.1 anti-sigma regulatory factor (Ser/Thr protein kinase) [Streptomyces sp. V3I7]
MSTWEYTLYVPHDPRAVGICRRALADILTSHQLPTLVDPAQLLASELLGNAIRHTAGPAALKLRGSGSSLRLGAWDTDPAPPTRLPPGEGENGHGLRLVHAYADDWGWFQVNGARGNGKYVWCELGADGH